MPNAEDNGQTLGTILFIPWPALKNFSNLACVFEIASPGRS
jgi:hypothetical protein